MKIAIITDYSKYTGIGIHNYSLLMKLRQLGLDVEIINLVSPQGYKEVPQYGINVISNILNNKYLSFGWGVFNRFRKGVKRILNNGNYTHVILGHQGLAYLGKSLQKNYETVIVVHDLFTLYGDKNGLDEFIYNRFLLKGIDRIKNLVFISEFTKKDFEKFYGNLNKHNSAVIYQHIDKNSVRDDIKRYLIKNYRLNNKKIIINVGSEDVRKNILTYLKIADNLKGKDDLLFVRIGKISESSKKYIYMHGLKNILYCSQISYEELVAWYDLSTIVLSTSLYEGWGRQIFDGYLYNNFVVTSNVSDVAKVFYKNKNVYIVDDAFNVDGYITCIKDILKIGDVPKKLNDDIILTINEGNNYLKFLTNGIKNVTN